MYVSRNDADRGPPGEAHQDGRTDQFYMVMKLRKAFDGAEMRFGNVYGLKI